MDRRKIRTPKVHMDEMWGCIRYTEDGEFDVQRKEDLVPTDDQERCGSTLGVKELCLKYMREEKKRLKSLKKQNNKSNKQKETESLEEAEKRTKQDDTDKENRIEETNKVTPAQKKKETKKEKETLPKSKVSKEQKTETSTSTRKKEIKNDERRRMLAKEKAAQEHAAKLFSKSHALVSESYPVTQQVPNITFTPHPPSGNPSPQTQPSGKPNGNPEFPPPSSGNVNLPTLDSGNHCPPPSQSDNCNFPSPSLDNPNFQVPTSGILNHQHPLSDDQNLTHPPSGDQNLTSSPPGNVNRKPLDSGSLDHPPSGNPNTQSQTNDQLPLSNSFKDINSLNMNENEGFPMQTQGPSGGFKGHPFLPSVYQQYQSSWMQPSLQYPNSRLGMPPSHFPSIPNFPSSDMPPQFFNNVHSLPNGMFKTNSTPNSSNSVQVFRKPPSINIPNNTHDISTSSAESGFLSSRFLSSSVAILNGTGEEDGVEIDVINTSICSSEANASLSDNIASACNTESEYHCNCCKEKDREISDLKRKLSETGFQSDVISPERKYRPKTRPEMKKGDYVLVSEKSAPPAGFQRLASGASVAVRALWLEEILTTIGKNSVRRNKRALKRGEPVKENHSGEIIKKLMDGFFDPHELGIDGGTSAFKDNEIYKSLKLYAIQVLNISTPAFNEFWGQKMASCRH